MPGFIKLSTNTNCFNKTLDLETESQTWELYEGDVDDGAIENLIEKYSMKGFAINASPLVGGRRKNSNSIGGNVVVVDLDDGIPMELVLATPTYRSYGAFYYPSCSSGVVAEKEGVDGRDRGRAGFRAEREFRTFTDNDENGFPPSDTRRNLERIAVTKYIADSLCADLGIPKLQDTCHRAVTQLWYGNSGTGLIDFTRKGEDGEDLPDTYQCSTDRRYDINRDGCLSAESMDRIYDEYVADHPEVFNPRKVKTAEEMSEEVEIARWILTHDLLSEEQLTVYTTAVTNVGGACKVISESLRDDWLYTMERVNDGHQWRLPSFLAGSWDRLDANYDRCIGSLINLADEASPGWRHESPFFKGTKKRNVFPISEAFSLMRSIPNVNIIL